MPNPPRVPVRARLAAAVGVAAVVALAAAPASAHVEPTPAAAEAGSTTTITFNVEHGCDDSPLVKLEIKVPDGVTGASAAPAPAGWKGEVVDGVVTFTGGPQPAHEPIDFAVKATLPKSGTSVAFPTIETCTEGTVEWLDPTVAGQDEPEHPAPTVKLTAGAPTAADEETDHHAEEGATETTEADHHAEEGTATTEADHHAEEGTSTTVAAGTSSSSDGGSDSNAGTIAISVVGVVVIVGGVALYLVSRKRRSA